MSNVAITGKIRYAQWFKLREGLITRMEVIYDPRPFLQLEGGA